MNFFTYENFLFLIIFIKIIFVLLLISKIILKKYNEKHYNKYIILLDKIIKYDNYFEIFFQISMGLLLTYLFNPNYPIQINLLNYETRLLLFLFGCLTIVYFIKDLKTI
jgi:hypothetical protein